MPESRRARSARPGTARRSTGSTSATPRSRPTTALRLEGIPVTRVENMCATGTEALRGAAYAVAAGAVDIALAIGAEKLKDTGYGGLPVQTKGTLNDLIMPYSSAPAGFAQLAAGYRAKYGVSKEDLKRAIGRISWKSHQNGAKNPKAHLQKEVDLDTILNAPIIADPLGSVRLLRRQRRRRLRDRHDARTSRAASARRTSSPSRRCSCRSVPGAR